VTLIPMTLPLLTPSFFSAVFACTAGKQERRKQKGTAQREVQTVKKKKSATVEYVTRVCQRECLLSFLWCGWRDVRCRSRCTSRDCYWHFAFLFFFLLLVSIVFMCLEALCFSVEYFNCSLRAGLSYMASCSMKTKTKLLFLALSLPFIIHCVV
jgi:hypothetical protein